MPRRPHERGAEQPEPRHFNVEFVRSTAKVEVHTTRSNSTTLQTDSTLTVRVGKAEPAAPIFTFDDGEAQRDDENYCHVSAWQWGGDPMKPNLNVEPLTFEEVHLATRSYK